MSTDWAIDSALGFIPGAESPEEAYLVLRTSYQTGLPPRRWRVGVDYSHSQRCGGESLATDADPGLWTTTEGKLFKGVTPAIPCLSGDVLKVYVDHGDSSPHDLASTTLSVSLVDRLGDQRGVGYRELILSD